MGVHFDPEFSHSAEYRAVLGGIEFFRVQFRVDSTRVCERWKLSHNDS